MAGVIALALLAVGCGRDPGRGAGQEETDQGYGYDSTNIGMPPGSGRTDRGGGVSEGDTPQEVRSAVTDAAGYERPSTNTAGATNSPSFE